MTTFRPQPLFTTIAIATVLARSAGARRIVTQWNHQNYVSNSPIVISRAIQQ